MGTRVDSEVDPLSTYEFPLYENRSPLQPTLPPYVPPTTIPNPPFDCMQPYPLNVKYEQSPLNSGYQTQPDPSISNTKPVENNVEPLETPQNLTNVKVENDKQIDSKKGIITEDDKTISKIKVEVGPKNVRRKPKKDHKNGQKSTYMSEKINPGYPFYGCAICNINFPTLQELDIHVTTHKNRFTSYDLRIKNQIRRKKLRKEQKRMKKLGAIVKQEPPDIDIKPEDGYIGMEPTAEFVNNVNTETETSQTSNDNSQTSCENGVNFDNDPSNISKVNKLPGFDVKSAALELKRMIQNEQHNLNNLQKIYKCFACNKQFTLSYYLKLHVRSHTDEKPYKCKECDQSFITASKLGRHIKRIHLAIRYTCRICYKVFTRFEYLTRHFDKKHSEDKLEGEPYDYNAILPYLKELEEQLRIKTEAEKETQPKTEGLWSDDWPDLTFNAANLPEMATNQPEVPTNLSEVPSNQPESALNQNDTVINQPVLSTFQEVTLCEQEVVQPDPEPNNTNDESNLSEHSDNDDYDMDSNQYDEQPFMPGNHLDIVIEEVKVPMADVKSEVEIKVEKVDAVKSEPKVKNEDSSDEDYFPINTWASKPKVDETPPSPLPKKKRQKTTGPIKCKECNKTINSASYLKVHMRTHTGEKPFKCYICNRGFITSSKMHRHVLTHNESWDENAKVKAEGEEIKEDEKEKKDEDKKNNESLKKAKAKFTKQKKKKAGEVTKKHQKRPHACEFCQQKFLHLETLNVHKKSHEGEQLMRQCHFCLIQMEDEEALKAHESTHGGPKPYNCTICGRNYKRRETMVYHRKHHKPDKTFICDFCSKAFNAQCKLQRHIVSHRVDKYVLRYECPVCAHMFHTKYHIQMHLSTHQKEGLISDENRNDILAMVLQNARKIPKSSSSDATASVAETMPADERSRVCNICGEVFQHFYYLEEHLKSHGSKIAIEDLDKVEEKRYVCQVCSKSFKLHYYLKLHTFTHTKEKPYVCQQCGKGFITKGKLKRHLETHTGLKKYQCHVCYKFFTRPSYLRIHVRTIHGTQDYNFKMLDHLNSLSVFGDRSV